MYDYTLLKPARDLKGLTQQQVANYLGVSQKSYDFYEKGERNPKFDKLIKLEQILDLKFKVSTNVQESSAKFLEKSPFVMIPLVTIRAKARYLAGYADSEFIEQMPAMPVLVDRQTRGEYRCFEIDGDSMDNGSKESICDKDIVLARKIGRHHWQNKLHIIDNLFIIVHQEMGLVLKQITSHNTTSGVVVCHSFNTYYDDFEVNLNEVVELYNLIKIVDRSL